MDRLRLDLVHTWRAFRARPGATLATMAVLSTGVGLVGAMFALADPFLLRPLPYQQPDELIVITLQQDRASVAATWRSAADVAMPTLADWQARHDLFAAVGAWRVSRALRLTLPAGAVALRTAQVTAGFFDVLGIPGPPVGAWRPASDSGALPMVMTAEALARVNPGDQRVLGRAFARQDTGSVRLLAALPSSFVFPREARAVRIDALVPADANQPLIERSRSGDGRSVAISQFTVLARLRPGVTTTSVRSALSATLGGTGIVTIDVRPLSTAMTGGVRPLALGALLAGVLILLVCAGNVANLLLARGGHRSAELATREALGASRADVMRLMLVELGLLTTGGIIGGLACAAMALSVAGVVMPADYTALGTPAVTLRVMMFTGAAGALVMLIGLVPGWTIWRVRTIAGIGQTIAAEKRLVRAVRFAAAAGQSAMAMILLAGAALLLRSYVNLFTQDTGFSGDMLVVSASYPAGHDGALLQQDIDATVPALRRIPGVQTVAAAVGPMADGLRVRTVILVNGRGVPAALKFVSPAYFDAIGSVLRAGRLLTTQDKPGTALVVNESLAKQLSPDRSAVGILTSGERPAVIVGIVRDTFDVALDRTPEPTVFEVLENPWADCTGACNNVVHYVLRLSSHAGDVGAIAQREVTRVNADAILVGTSSMEERLAGSVKERAFATLILSLFAAASVTVCVAGLVGIVTFIVARRTREIAIRMVIGANAAHVLSLVLREALGAAATGIVVGLLIGGWLSRWLGSLLYGVQAGDRVTLVLTGLGMLAIVAIASAMPAVRALRRSPTDALRIE
jgi:putative ABC transport system permease protein